MGTTLLPRNLLFGLCGMLLAISFATAAQAETASVVVGSAKCLDCSRKNIKAENAFKGLQVVIKCKTSGEHQIKNAGPLDNTGSFNIPLSADLLEDGELKKECFAEVHSAASSPCPGQEPSKLILKSKENGKHITFTTSAEKLPFASATCVSAFSLPPYKWDPFHKSFPLHKPLLLPPKPVYKPPTPVYTPTPVYKPPTPVYKPPTPVPIYKPFFHPHPTFKFPPMYKKFPPMYKKFPPYAPHPGKYLKKHPFFPPAKHDSKT